VSDAVVAQLRAGVEAVVEHLGELAPAGKRDQLRASPDRAIPSSWRRRTLEATVHGGHDRGEAVLNAFPQAGEQHRESGTDTERYDAQTSIIIL